MDSLALIAIAIFVIAIVLPIVAMVKVSGLRKSVDALKREVDELRLQGTAPSTQAQPDSKADEPDISEADKPPLDEPAEEEPDQTEADIPPEQIPPLPEDALGRPTRIALSTLGASAKKWSSPASTRTMEQTLGTKWTVWVGGLALALGGIFLVKYTIEAGLLGPGVRIALGALFALCLAAAGEYVRRKDITADLAGVPSAYIPGVLTAAGVLSGFATIYAAYALYEFLPPLLAFILLAACSIAALSASWLHGPGLAALGLVGSYATPLLVSTQAPKAWPLFIYLLFVTAAAFFVARLRGWLWLAASAAAGATLWGLVWCAGPWKAGDTLPLGFYILALTALAFYFLAYVPDRNEEDDDSSDGQTMATLLMGTDWVATGILAAITFLVIPTIRVDDHSILSLLLLAAATLALLGGAWRWHNLSALVGWAALLFAVVFATWHIPQLLAPTPFVAYLDATLPTPHMLWRFLVTGALFAAGFAVSGFLNPLSGGRHIIWTLLCAIMPVVIFAYAYLRATRFEQDVPFGMAGLLVAFLYVAASEVMHRKGDEPLWPWRSGVYAASAVVALALAFTILLEQGWLTIALALICPGLGWVALKRPVPGLRYLAAGMALVVMARLAFDPVIVGDALGRTPILNWLLYGYGVPAVAFVAASWLFRQQEDGREVQILEAAGILCTVVLVGLQIRHLLNDGNVYSRSFDLAELSIHTIAMLGLAIGLQKLYDRAGRMVVEKAAAILGLAGLAAILFGHLIVMNPIYTAESIGENRFFNLLLLAYVVPTLLCAVLYLVSRNRLSQYYGTAIGATALLLLLAYLSLETRALFHGAILRGGGTSDAEWYSYSAVWLLYGVSLLGGGIVTGMAALRYASLAILILTVGKVFLSDLSHLSGILRALSFIGLGAFLVGIGYFYQRFVFPQPTEAEKPIGEKS